MKPSRQPTKIIISQKPAYYAIYPLIQLITVSSKHTYIQSFITMKWYDLNKSAKKEQARSSNSQRQKNNT